jgi:hypothetical protein
MLTKTLTMKINLLYIFFSFILFFNTNNELKAQTNACSGTIQAGSLGNWGSGTQIGNGTPGNIQVCITANSLVSAGMSCSSAQLVVSTGNGTGIQVIWSETTANGTCFTFASGTGFGWLSKSCFGAGSQATLTWTTVNGSGVPVCPTCSDGIQNQGETGIDCGGPCAPCVANCSDGIQNQGETGIDCGGPCGPCGGPSCSDGIQNQDETGIDCGGTICSPCATCFDGIQNGTETGVDCGGSCVLVCSTNGAVIDGNSTNCCNTTTPVSVYPTNCDQVGTAAYNLNSPVVELVSQSVSGGCLPSPSPTGCGAVTGTGTWAQMSLEDGVDYLQMSWAQGAGDGIGSGNSTTYSALYQGTGCGALSYVSCQPIVDFNSGSYGIYQATWSGLDPNQNVWIYTWNDNNKAFNLDFQFIGVNQPPTNTGCATASIALGDACNLGATGASFTTPGAGGVACTGGNWGSNENTTFYSFTADATTGSLLINNIICNDGTSGNAQFAVWTSCAGIGTYGAGSGFLGCAVGTGAISLSPLVVGQTYYVAADGFAGDNCTWSFTGTGILLPIKMGSFTGFHNGREVELDWTTITEKNNDYFIVQRTVDGIIYENIGTVKGAGTTNERQNYSLVDYRPYDGTSYYRIKQTDYDGAFEYSDIISVKHGETGLLLIRTVNLMGQEVDHNYSGMVIDVYSDGSTIKRIKM